MLKKTVFEIALCLYMLQGQFHRKKLLSSSVSTVAFYVAVLLYFSAGNLSAKWLAKNLFCHNYPVGRDVTASFNYTAFLSTHHNFHPLILKY